MKYILPVMTVLMGFTMSLVLSFTGTLAGGHFTVQSWLFSFGISFLLSLAIGFIVPVKKAGDAFCKKCRTVPECPKGNFLSALISNLIYTPLLTIVMVGIMVMKATAQIPVLSKRLEIMAHAVVPSLIICFVVGYVAIVIFQPLFIRLLMGKRPDC